MVDSLLVLGSEMGDTEYLVSILRYFPQEVLGSNTRMVSNWATDMCMYLCNIATPNMTETRAHTVNRRIYLASQYPLNV